MNKRDSRGRFVNRRAHEYVLKYAASGPEVVYALSATDAVAARTTPALPITLTDMTVMRDWAGGLGYASLVPDRDEPVMAPLTWMERMASRGRETGRAS